MLLKIKELSFLVQTEKKRSPDTELSKKLGISRKSLWEKGKIWNQ